MWFTQASKTGGGRRAVLVGLSLYVVALIKTKADLEVFRLPFAETPCKHEESTPSTPLGATTGHDRSRQPSISLPRKPAGRLPDENRFTKRA